MADQHFLDPCGTAYLDTKLWSRSASSVGVDQRRHIEFFGQGKDRLQDGIISSDAIKLTRNLAHPPETACLVFPVGAWPGPRRLDHAPWGTR